MDNEEKYIKMAEQLRKDGVDEYTIEKFIRQEREADEFAKSEGTTSIDALKEWREYPDELKDMFLHNAFCINCGTASFRPGYNIRKNKWGLIIEGNCTVCGGKIVRTTD